MSETCAHLEAALARRAGVKPSGPGCVECLASGGVWVHLRLCLTCGHVGCCDNSPNKPRHQALPHHASTRSSDRTSRAKTGATATPTTSSSTSCPAKPGEAAKRHFDPPHHRR